jgi:MinD superfamily P-loop ATPase
MDAIDRIRKRMALSAERKYTFFLNGHPDFAFSNCPRCSTKTRVRKFALLIHIDPNQFFVLNKKCRFCTNCELIIAKKEEVESIMAWTFEKRSPEIIGNDYLIMGTVDKKIWRLINNNAVSPQTAVKSTNIFKRVVDFKIEGGWAPA